MLRGYIRPEPRFPAAKQREALEKFGVKLTYEEALRKRGDAFPQRDALVKSLRPSQKDAVTVSHFHRLASDFADLIETIGGIFAKDFVIVEASTGRRSTDPKSLSDMIFEAYAFYAQRGLTSEQAARMGKKGAAVSSASKPSSGRMPLSQMLTILKDMTLSITDALIKINADKNYPQKSSLSYIYRMRRKGKLPFPGRPAGPKIQPRSRA